MQYSILFNNLLIFFTKSMTNWYCVLICLNMYFTTWFVNIHKICRVNNDLPFGFIYSLCARDWEKETRSLLCHVFSWFLFYFIFSPSFAYVWMRYKTLCLSGSLNMSFLLGYQSPDFPEHALVFFILSYMSIWVDVQNIKMFLKLSLTGLFNYSAWGLPF